MNTHAKKQPKDVNSVTQTRFIMSKRHDLALGCVDEVLAADPDIPEALFVKAQILWEGYQDAAAAKQCLFHLMKVEPDKEASFHRWSLSLYKEIATSKRNEPAESEYFTTEGHGPARLAFTRPCPRAEGSSSRWRAGYHGLMIKINLYK